MCDILPYFAASFDVCELDGFSQARDFNLLARVRFLVDFELCWREVWHQWLD